MNTQMNTQMKTNYTFTNEKFSITEDIFFTVDTTVIKGNKICKLKTLKIFYHEEVFEMKYGTTVYKYIIKDGIRSIYSIELVNYLNRLINHENLFEVYLDSKSMKIDPNHRCVDPRYDIIQQEISSFIIHDKSNNFDPDRYKSGLIDHGQFIKSELIKLRNPKFSNVYSDYESIDQVPIYCYIHPSLAINQKNTIILCHLGYILEKLANYHRFPEFNTQAVLSFLNATNKSKLYDKTVEEINVHKLLSEIERLKNENDALKIKLYKKKSRINHIEENINDVLMLLKSASDEK